LNCKYIFGTAHIPEPSKKVYYNVQNSGVSCAFNAPLQCLYHLPFFREILEKDEGVRNSELGNLFRNIFSQMGLPYRTSTLKFRQDFCNLYWDFVRNRKYPGLVKFFDSSDENRAFENRLKKCVSEISRLENERSGRVMVLDRRYEFQKLTSKDLEQLKWQHTQDVQKINFECECAKEEEKCKIIKEKYCDKEALFSYGGEWLGIEKHKSGYTDSNESFLYPFLEMINECCESMRVVRSFGNNYKTLNGFTKSFRVSGEAAARNFCNEVNKVFSKRDVTAEVRLILDEFGRLANIIADIHIGSLSSAFDYVNAFEKIETDNSYILKRLFSYGPDQKVWARFLVFRLLDVQGVVFNETIDIAPYMNFCGLMKLCGEKIEYELVGAVEFNPVIAGGHYMAYVKINGEWYKFSCIHVNDGVREIEDEAVNLSQEASARGQVFNIENELKRIQCVSLFYQLKDITSAHPYTIFSWEQDTITLIKALKLLKEKLIMLAGILAGKRVA
jgi:hypothetical protein